MRKRVVESMSIVVGKGVVFVCVCVVVQVCPQPKPVLT